MRYVSAGYRRGSSQPKTGLSRRSSQPQPTHFRHFCAIVAIVAGKRGPRVATVAIAASLADCKYIYSSYFLADWQPPPGGTAQNCDDCDDRAQTPSKPCFSPSQPPATACDDCYDSPATSGRRPGSPRPACNRRAGHYRRQRRARSRGQPAPGAAMPHLPPHSVVTSTNTQPTAMQQTQSVLRLAQLSRCKCLYLKHNSSKPPRQTGGQQVICSIFQTPITLGGAKAS